VRRISLVFVAAVGLLALAASPAAAQETAAATCSPRDDTINAGTGGDERFAHVFSPSLSGSLTRAEIDIVKSGSAGSYVVQVMGVDGTTGAPSNAVLASTAVPDSMPDGDFLLNAVFSSPAPVTAGQNYALVITRPGSDMLRTGIRNDCPGNFYYSTAGSTDWQIDAPNESFVFTAFVTPPSTPTGQRAAALKKCKKKHSKKARKKCRKKAKRLPV
jgi:hypothetical protein